MDIKELRIGNLVYDSNRNIEKINQLMVLMELVKINDWYDTDYFPIPLTEDHLKLFDFEYNEDKGFSSDEATRKIYSLGNFDLSIEEDGSIRAWEECDDPYYSCYGKEFKYVHRLQNYFFENTDKELQMKELA